MSKAITLNTFIFGLLSCLPFGVSAQILVNQKPTSLETRVVRLDQQVNSDASDLAPVRYGDRIYFTSSRKNAGDEQPTSRIYSFIDGKKATPVAELNPSRKAQNVGQVAFMPDASRIYFTVCKDDAQKDCSIWYRDRTFDGGWSAAKRMPDYINQRGTTTTMPTIGWDEEQKKFVLFFVSDRQGGMGGLDIWCSPITWDGKYETPYPLPVNSEKDDVTPFFHRASQTLYFSTNGRGGAGRFDIFIAEKKADMWARPYSLGRPYNTSYDDLYFTIHDASQMAYLTSDRPGSLCGNSASGHACYDLYQVDQKVPQLRIRPFSLEEKMEASNTKRTK
jgi:hypothetical protein